MVGRLTSKSEAGKFLFRRHLIPQKRLRALVCRTRPGGLAASSRNTDVRYLHSKAGTQLAFAVAPRSLSERA